ncbi:MAG: tetratricopeptide repeat protein [Acidobacteriota bacterium]
MLRSPIAHLAIVLSLVLLATPAFAKVEIAGIVSAPDGKPIKDIQVTILSPDTAMVGQEETNRKGEFEIKLNKPDPGSYTIRFEGEGWSPFEGQLEIAEDTTGQEVNVTLIDAEAGRKHNAVSLYNEGAALHTQGDLDGAMERFLKVTEMDAEVAAAWLGIADIHVRNGDAASAIPAIERYRELEPEEEQGMKLAFEAYRLAGDTDKANELAKALGMDNLSANLAIGIYNEGAVASQTGDYETALAKFSEATRLDPSLAEAHAGIASVLYNQQDLAGALAAAEKALQVDPESLRGRRMQFLAHDAAGTDQARIWETWESYREVDAAGAVDLLYNRARMEFEAANIDVAREALSKVLEVDAEYPRAYYTLGLTYTADDPAKAKEYLEKFIALAPDDPEVATAREILSYL